ncbi:MAG: molybdenum cofactor guanylyltransferase [Rhodothermaceae bacterium]
MIKNTQNKDLTFAVIAGGKSKRFGSNKLLHKFNGKRFIDFSLELGKSLTENVVIIGDSDFPSDLNFPVIKDHYKDMGPLAAIYTALINSETDFIAVTPGDMPLLKKEIYEILLQNISAKKIIAAESEKGLEPLVSVWPKTAAAELKKFLEEDNLSIKSFLNSIGYISIEFKDDYQKYFANINRLSELEELKNSGS